MNPGPGLIQRWRQLPTEERQDLWPAAWRLLLVWSLLGTLGLGRTAALLARGSVRPATTAIDIATWRRRALALRRVGARLPGARCVARALCLSWWMRCHGYPAVMKMGVDRGSAGASLAGHAWVEWDGEPVDDTRDGIGRFLPLRWS